DKPASEEKEKQRAAEEAAHADPFSAGGRSGRRAMAAATAGDQRAPRAGEMTAGAPAGSPPGAAPRRPRPHRRTGAPPPPRPPARGGGAPPPPLFRAVARGGGLLPPPLFSIKGQARRAPPPVCGGGLGGG